MASAIGWRVGSSTIIGRGLNLPTAEFDIADTTGNGNCHDKTYAISPNGAGLSNYQQNYNAAKKRSAGNATAMDETSNGPKVERAASGHFPPSDFGSACCGKTAEDNGSHPAKCGCKHATTPDGANLFFFLHRMVRR